MAKNKYARDYRLLETVDQRGRIHTDYEYIGRPYRFDQGEEQARRELRLRLIVCVAGWMGWLAAMLPNSRAMRTLWISLPFVLTAVPLGMLTGVVFSLLRVSQPMEHRFADKLANRYPPAALCAGILPAISILGTLAQLLRGDFSGEDGVFLFCALCPVLCGALCFARRKRLSASAG